MAFKQLHRTPKRECTRCGVTSQLTEKVSKRLRLPDGGNLCPECLVPSAIEALERS